MVLVGMLNFQMIRKSCKMLKIIHEKLSPSLVPIKLGTCEKYIEILKA